MSQVNRRLYRSESNRMIWGVCGGLANYFDMDPIIFRIAFVLLAFEGVGILGYILLAIFVPRESRVSQTASEAARESIAAAGQAAKELGQELQDQVKAAGPSYQRHATGPVIIGAVLVILGGVLLLSNIVDFWWFSWGRLWPVLLILPGLMLLLGIGRR